MNKNKDEYNWPPTPTPSQEVLLPGSKKRAIPIPAVLLGLVGGAMTYAVGLIALLIGYVIIVFIGAKVQHYNYNLYYALFIFKNFVWYAQRFIALTIPVFTFMSIRRRHLALAIGFIIGGLIMLSLLLLLYPFVPLED